ncbi:MAG TPA: DUF4398 domain-containing protein [Polyangiaceae bacterium]|nr:DUF4398 domain-containing protein [Polyangiaceae bacterium]
MSYQRFSRLGWVALALVTSACGSAVLDQAKLNQAQTAMHAAETLGAANDPQAKQSLQQAGDNIAQAKRFAQEGDIDEANLYLKRAMSDADLASQVMRTRTEEGKAREAWAKSKATMGETGAPQ